MDQKRYDLIEFGKENRRHFYLLLIILSIEIIIKPSWYLYYNLIYRNKIMSGEVSKYWYRKNSYESIIPSKSPKDYDIVLVRHINDHTEETYYDKFGRKTKLIITDGILLKYHGFFSNITNIIIIIFFILGFIMVSYAHIYHLFKTGEIQIPSTRENIKELKFYFYGFPICFISIIIILIDIIYENFGLNKYL